MYNLFNSPVLCFISILLFLFLYSENCSAQFDIPDKAKEKINERIEKKVDESIDDALDSAEEKEPANEESDNVDKNFEQNPNNPVENKKQEIKAYSKFDFVAGEKIIFYEDFVQDNVGDFPVKWNTNSSGEVVTIDNADGRWLQLGTDGVYYPEVSGSFGENFTFEFDLIYSPKADYNHPSFSLDFISTLEGERMDELVPGAGGFSITNNAYNISIFNWSDKNYSDISNDKDNEFFLNNINSIVHISLAVQKQRVRYWINEAKIYDLPRLIPGKLIIDRVRFNTSNQGDDNPYLFITNIKIAAGQPDVRSKLITEGKLVTRGILFDVNSDKLKPESYGTLKEISQVLKDNGEIRVKIYGHTDSDGSDDLNLDLSKRRAASVKAFLISEFFIDAARMDTDGKGETEPVDNNNTPEGKANNRRVEFIKL